MKTLARSSGAIEVSKQGGASLTADEYLGTNKIVNQRKPVVSVCVTTYQHAPYIRQCLEAVLKQRTSFFYEVIVGEDESVDGTREICKEYAERYPDRIRLFLRSRSDVIYLFDRPTGRYNFLENIKASRGKYIAICEGDDYWTDDTKLQAQYDFLENNMKCSGCIHDAHIYSEKRKTIIGSYSTMRPFKTMWANKNSLDRNDILRHWHCGPTASFFFRNIIKSFPTWIYTFYGADTGLMLILSEKGKIGLNKNSMSVYRFENSESLMGQDGGSRLRIIKLRIKESISLMSHFDIKARFYLLKRIFRLVILGIRFHIVSTARSTD